MSLDNVRQAHEDLTGKLGDVNRQLVFAGIATLWIFKYTATTGVFALPDALKLPTLLFASALAADLLQYAYSALLYSVMFHFYEYRFRSQAGTEAQLAELSENFDHPRWWDWPTYAFLVLKVLLNIVAYSFLLTFLWKDLVATAGH